MKTKKYGIKALSVLSVVVAIGAFVFPGLSNAEGPLKPPDSNRMQPGFAPTPFSAAEIKANCPWGRKIVYQIETFGKPLFFQTTTFGTDKGEETVFNSVNTGEDGKQIGQKEYMIAKWTDLQSHASFPEKQTEIKSETFTTPAGSFDCWLYIVKSEKDPDKGEKRFWFAKSLPGPPVCFEETMDGKVTFRLTMLKTGLEKN